MTVNVTTITSSAGPVVFQQINFSDTSGSLSLVAAAAGKVVKVWRLAVYGLAGTDITFNSHNAVGPVDTPIYGPIGFGGTAGQGNWLDPSQVQGSLLPWFQTGVNQSLTIVSTGGSRVSGIVLYTVE